MEKMENTYFNVLWISHADRIASFTRLRITTNSGLLPMITLSVIFVLFRNEAIDSNE